MKKLNNKHHYLVLSTNKTAEIFLPVLAKFKFEYKDNVNDLNKTSKTLIISMKDNVISSRENTFWFANSIDSSWKLRKDILVIENCSSNQLESVLSEYYGISKSIKLFL